MSEEHPRPPSEADKGSGRLANQRQFATDFIKVVTTQPEAAEPLLQLMTMMVVGGGKAEASDDVIEAAINR